MDLEWNGFTFILNRNAAKSKRQKDREQASEREVQRGGAVGGEGLQEHIWSLHICEYML